jgi:hypothetical protein
VIDPSPASDGPVLRSFAELYRAPASSTATDIIRWSAQSFRLTSRRPAVHHLLGTARYKRLAQCLFAPELLYELGAPGLADLPIWLGRPHLMAVALSVGVCSV